MEETEESASVEAQPIYNPDFLNNLHARMTTTLSSGSGPDEGMLRKFVEFVMPATVCGPAVTEDFILTLATLTSGQELAAARSASGDAVAMGMNMARESVYSVNGKRVTKGSGHLDLLWEALGPPGRNLVIQQWSNLSVASDEDMGKANATVRVF